MSTCTRYCDERCNRRDWRPEHDGFCFAHGMVWREATDEEIEQFEAERAEANAER